MTIPVKATQKLIREMLVNAITYEKDGNPSDALFLEMRNFPKEYASGNLSIGPKPENLFVLEDLQAKKLSEIDEHTVGYCRTLIGNSMEHDKTVLTASLADLICAAIVVVNWVEPEQ